MIDRIRAESHIPGVLLVHHHAMGPGSHQQFLRALLQFRQRGEVLGSGASVRVVPGAAVEGRDIGMLGVVFVNGIATLLPVLVIVTMNLQVERPLLVTRQQAQRGGPFLERQLTQPPAQIIAGLQQSRPQSRVRARFFTGHGHMKGIDEEALFQSAVLSHGARVVV